MYRRIKRTVNFWKIQKDVKNSPNVESYQVRREKEKRNGCRNCKIQFSFGFRNDQNFFILFLEMKGRIIALDYNCTCGAYDKKSNLSNFVGI